LEEHLLALYSSLTSRSSRTYHHRTLPEPIHSRLAHITSTFVVTLALASCAVLPPMPRTPIAFAAPSEQVPEPPTVPIVVEAEPVPQIATGGDPSSVNNATIQLRSEYGDLWTRIRDGFALSDLDTPEVKTAEDWYRARPDYVARMVERSRRYLYYIVTEVTKRDMPLEIALLPMIESAFNPMAFSKSRASGIWQFMPATGKNFGLKQNWWLDERRDVLAATDGALDYLQKLYAEFGDWYLALAAYNWGEGSVRRAVAYNLKRGLPTDYLSLSMPVETRNYVPKLQAIKNIVSDPEAYSLDLADIPDAPYFAVVTTNKKIDVKIAAELAEMPLDEFLSLNPQHNRPVIAGADEATILLPYDKAEVFANKLELSDQPMVTWQAYKVRGGETLPQIAARFGMPLETLRTVNGIGARAAVPVGHALLVPSQAPSDATAASLQNTVFTAVPSARTVYHRVRKGETVASIAAHYDVTAQDLQTWNVGLNGRITPGQRLRIVSDYAPASGTPKRGKGKTPPNAGGVKSATRQKSAGRTRAAASQHP
jgi:membrane-bound lytic murein transglycosylase D